MFALLKKSKELDLPIDLQLELFDSLILPILLYGCEVWGYENVLILDGLYLKYLEYVLGLKQSTPSCMVYGETGRFPLSVYIKTQIISFWCKLVSDKLCQTSCQAVFMIYFVTTPLIAHYPLNG